MNLSQVPIYKKDLQQALGQLSLPPLAGKSMLVTGASGMIGSCLIDLLMCYNASHQQKIQITAAARRKNKLRQRFPEYLNRPEFRILEQDVTQPVSVPLTADYIVHAASNAAPGVFRQDPVGTMTANFIGMYNLLQAAKKKPAARILYISSGEVYGNTSLETKKETDYGFVDPLDVRSCYPNSKRAAETLCVAFSEQYSLEVVIARPSHTYGPTMTASDDRASSAFLRDALNDKDIILHSQGTFVRSYTYIVDTAAALLKILLFGKNKEAYNIANEKSILSIRQYANLVAACSGKKVKIEIPADYDASKETKITRQVLDSAKLRSLGWQAQTNDTDGIKKTLAILKTLKSNDR